MEYVRKNSEGKKAPIDFGEILQIISKNRREIVINLLIAFIMSSAIVVCIPRYYNCSVKLAPEISGTNTGGGFGALATGMGLNISSLSSQDAINPELYPDLMASVDFRTSMFSVKVKTIDDKICSSYYDYLVKNQKSPFWISSINTIKNIFKGESKEESSAEIVPFRLTKAQSEVATIIGGKIKCSVDKKTDVITITIEDQDPLVSAIIADSARERLQDAIIAYRTNKARIDLEYAKKINSEAKQKYDRARQLYAHSADANNDVTLESYKTKIEDLENEMQLKYNIYQQTSQQLHTAQAKLQERTPSFTVLQSATVPLKPAGPKRVLTVFVVCILTFIATLIYEYVKSSAG